MELRQSEPDHQWHDFVMVRLLRRWVAARAAEEQPLPTLVALAAELGEPPIVAIALQSVFQLTENCLGRQLEAECCCSPTTSHDERAMLMLVAAAPAPGLPFASRSIPHGLPGALCWATASAKLAMNVSPRQGEGTASAACPFDQRRPTL